MIKIKNVSMEFDLNRGKVRSLKEKLFSKFNDEVSQKRLFKALNNISIDIKKGEIFGIIGGNGAGKSTLLKIIAGIMKPSEGQIEVKGIISPMIELGTGFDFELSALENIFLSGAVLGFNRSQLESKVENIFEFSELNEFRDVPVKYFSSGMVARLAFAIATIVTPDILIVDEILAVGDIAFQKKSLGRMKDLITSGATVIYVSHDIESVKELCENVLWLDKGNIRCLGKAEEVCDKFIKEM